MKEQYFEDAFDEFAEFAACSLEIRARSMKIDARIRL